MLSDAGESLQTECVGCLANLNLVSQLTLGVVVHYRVRAPGMSYCRTIVYDRTA
jgi:hypothetical protein